MNYSYNNMYPYGYTQQYYGGYQQPQYQQPQQTSYFPYNTLLIRMDGHITVSINSVIYDIWDCSYEFVTDFWIVR